MLAFLVASPQSARSSGPTNVSGTISVDTTWTSANSPYVLTGLTNVAAGVTLTIQPGVVVKGSGQGVGLTVYGSMSAVGSSSQPIIFTSSADSLSGQWYGLTFAQGSGASTLQYVNVRYGGGFGGGDGNGMVDISGGAVTIADSTFSDSSVSGLIVSGGTSGSASTVTVTRSKFVHNGFSGTARQGDGLYTNEANVSIRDSAFWSNAGDGVHFQVDGSYTAAQATMAGTSVWNNTRYGVYVLDGDGTTHGLVGHVSGQDANVIYDNGTFGFTQFETWNQLYVSNRSTTLDWSDVYWGPVTYQPCAYGTQLGHLSYGVADPDPSNSPIQIDRGPLSREIALDPSGQSWCGNDRVIVNAPRQTMPSIHFNPPAPPSFGGLIPQALWDCKSCLRHFPELASSLDANSPNPAKNVGDPVNTATGDFLENATDLRLAGPGTPFSWTRSYNSADTGTSALGVGWTDMFEAKLSGGLASAASVTYRAGSGQQTVFTNASGNSSGSATYYAKGFDGTFKRLNDGTFSMVTRDQRTFNFDANGKLTSIKPRFMPATTLAYTSGKLNSITDGAGCTITITYSTSNPSLISAVTFPDSRSVQYGYTGGLLTSVTDTRGKVTTLAYDANNRLTSMQDPLSRYRVQNVTYDSQGRVTSEQNGAGDATSYAYSNDGTYDLTTVTFPGHTGSWVYKHYGNQVASVTDPLGRTTSYTYDGMGRTATVTDPRGNTTSYQYDHFGNVVKTVAPAPLSYTTTATYNATNDLSTETDGRGHSTSYTYATSSDPAADYQVGQLKTVTDRAGGVTTYTYLTTSSSPTPPSTNLGLLKAVTDQRSKTSAYAYDSAGNLTSITSPLGLKTTMTYDGSGRLLSKRDPRGNAVIPAAGYLTQWTYNNADQIATLTDAHGNVTTYDYFDNGLPQDVVRTDRGNVTRTTSFTYNANNQLASTTDPRSGVEAHLYWPDGSLKKVTSPAGRITTYGYDDAGELTSRVDPSGNATGGTPSDYTTAYAYDGSGNRISAQHLDGGTTQVAYDALNRPIQWTDADSHSTTASYDANGNLAQRTDALSHTVGYAYDNLDQLTSDTDELNKTTSYTYFPSGQLASVTTPLGNKTTYALDDDGRVTSMVEPRGNISGGTPSQYTWTYGYDGAGNRTSVTDPLSHQTAYSYDELNNVTQTTDANSHTTGFSYDVMNRLWKVTPPAAGNSGTLDTVYSYDADGNLANRVDPNGNSTSWSYDLDGLQTQKTAPVGIWNYTRDANGNLKSVETPVGSATTTSGDGTIGYGYDRMNRLTSVTYSDTTPAIGRSYDGAGRLTGMTDGSGSVAYSYDNGDRLTDVTRTGGGAGLNGTLHYGYDAAGQITGRTYPDSTSTSATYSDDGQLASVVSGGNTTSFSYDAAGNLAATTNPSGNGYSENRTYDRAGRLTGVDNTKSGTSLSKFTWTRDAVGNPTLVDALRAGTDTYDGYQYDARDRLTTACYGIASTATDCTGAANAIAYSYDKVDNLTQQIRSGSVSNTGTMSYSYNGADQLTSSTKSGVTTNYSYDANGNETSDGTSSFTYNLENELGSSTTAGVTTSYSYDGDGNRLTSHTSGGADLNYTWDNHADSGIPELIIEQTSSGSLVRRYLDGPSGAVSMATSGGTYYYAHDPLGSVSDVTDSSGAAQWAYSYEPYGVARTTSNVSGSAPENPLQFDGQYVDIQAGTYNLRAREYESGIGRFGGIDPLAQPVTEPALNDYRYADANPLLFDDRTGEAIPLDQRSYGAHYGSNVWGDHQLNGYPSLQEAEDENAPGVREAFGDLRSHTSIINWCDPAGLVSAYRDLRSAKAQWDAWMQAHPQVLSAIQVLAAIDGEPVAGVAPGVPIDSAAEEGAGLEATPAGRVFSAHYLNETGPVRNIPGSVVDEAIDHGQVVEKLADRTVYFDAKNDVTIVQSDTTGKIMSVRRGAP
jgi:RHS repeat-associated protein